MTDEIKQETPTEPLSIVDEARAERQKIEELLNETKKLLLQNQEVEAKILLSGRANAGEHVEKKEETAKEYAERIMKNNINKQ